MNKPTTTKAMTMTVTAPEYIKCRNAHASRVIRDKVKFMEWYDTAALAVFEGESKADVIDAIAPWGCSPTQSNGVVAGANQAARLMRMA